MPSLMCLTPVPQAVGLSVVTGILRDLQLLRSLALLCHRSRIVRVPNQLYTSGSTGSKLYGRGTDDGNDYRECRYETNDKPPSLVV